MEFSPLNARPKTKEELGIEVAPQFHEKTKECLSISNKIALFVTNAVGTLWCALVFAILALISLPQEIHGGTTSIIDWITQTFLQLVLLSIILVGQNIQTKRSELKSEIDLKTDLAIKKELEILIGRVDIIEAGQAKKLDKILKILESKGSAK